MQNLTNIFLLVQRVCTQPLHCSINFTFYFSIKEPYFNIRCFSIKVVSQAKGVCSANVLCTGADVNNG